MKRAHLTIDPHFVVGRVNRRLFGSFVEHLGRCVYDGIYEPSHPSADAEGYRADVIELVRELGVSTIRYPGGNFVSGYRWEDGVGPRDERPRRLDLAWHSTETNEVGLDEFASWLRKVGSDLMYAVNLGTRGVQEALDVLEYANIRSGTALSDRRVANGAVEPHDIRMWCLGNEMDGPWQLGHGTAEDYAQLASKTARAMRQVDPDLELVVCGSSSAHMPTFGEWERIVLEQTYDDVDYISCHAYYEPKNGDYASFLASAVDMDRFIDSVAATADHVKAVRGSEKTMHISFDEWNVWYQSRYHEVRVTAASLAQLVNVIAPIMTEPGGPAWRQTTFFPFSVTSALARGVTLELKLDCPTVRTDLYGDVPLVDAVATHDSDTGATAVFLVNRSLDEEVSIDIDMSILGDVSIGSFRTLHDDDIHAVNTLTEQDRVSLRDNDTARVADGVVTVTLPPVSWSALTLA